MLDGYKIQYVNESFANWLSYDLVDLLIKNPAWRPIIRAGLTMPIEGNRVSPR